MKWILYKRGTIPLYRADLVLRGVLKCSKKMNGEFVSTFYMNTGPLLEWSWGEKQMKKLIIIIAKKCNKPASFLKHFKKLMKCGAQSIRAAEKIRAKNLKGINNQQLLKQYDFLDKCCLPAEGLFDLDIDAFDIFAEELVIKKLEEELPKLNNSKIIEIYRQLFRPLYQSYITEREKEIMKLVSKKKVSLNDIEKIYRKFWWTNLGWENVIPYDKNYFIEIIEKYKKKKGFEKKLREINNQLQTIKKEREGIIKEYHLNQNIRHWLNVSDKYNLLHDKRKEMQVKNLYAYYLLLKETSRRLNLKADDLEWMRHDEVKNLLKGNNIDKEEIKRRKKAIAILVTEKKINIWSGQVAIQVRRKELKSKIIQVKEFKGMGVSLGKVIGKAKVCNGAVDALKKIKKGDILVCPMTLPDYVPAMKLSAAIVTDEGGMTCHAAIISRELKIPCIIGTKIATKVLKDGQLVEVDANKGIVRILK